MTLNRVRLIHASGRFTATVDQLIAALDVYAAQADVITVTEVSPARFHRSGLLRWADQNGWHVHHTTGAGENECAILSRWPLARRKTFRLTPLTLKTGRTAPIYLVAARIKDGPWIGVWHTPAHNDGLRPGLWPTRVYQTALTGLRQARMRMHGGGVAIAADWNLDLRRPSVRAHLARPYPRMRWALTRHQTPTQGGRVIDGVLTNRQVIDPATTLPPEPGFDHRAVSVVLGPVRKKKGHK